MSGLINRLYFAAPVWAQNALLSAYGVRLRRLRYGRRQRLVLAELRESQWWPADRIHEMQLAALTALVGHARKTVPLYATRGLPREPVQLDDRWLAVPLLHKQELRQSGRGAISTTAPRWRLAEVHTGGTTGTPLTVYCDRATLQRNYAFFGRLREWAGLPPGARVATFAGRTVVPAGQARPPFWRVNAAANNWLFSSYHISAATLPWYVDALRRVQPELIDSYPSSLEPIARYLLDRGLGDIRPRTIITSSETLTSEARALLERAFGCQVFDHYGGGEMVALITQCERGAYHVNPEFGLVELLRDGRPVAPGETGEIVATGFINPVMPLIRYATGDWAVWGSEACPCGRAFPTVASIEGRRDDVLVTPDGRLIGRLDPIFKKVSSLWETRIIQDRPDHVRVEVVVTGDGLGPDEEASLTRELALRLGPAMHIDLVRVPCIPRTQAGKFRAVINLVAARGEASAHS